MNKLVFFVPGAYSIYTRFKGIKGLVSFIFKYFLIVLLASLACAEPFGVARFIVGVLLMFSLYEYGYIQNDCETIKKEQKPTMRLSTEELAFYEKNKTAIYSLRVIETACLLFVSYLLNVNTFLIFYSLLILPVFLVYNAIRCKWNLHIHVVLMFLRYSLPVFFACNHFDALASFWILLVHPLLIFIELNVKGKFGYQNKFLKKYVLKVFDDKHVNAFRVKYFSLLTLVSVLWTIADSHTVGYLYLVSCCMFFYTSVYAVSIVAGIKNKKNI